MMTLKLRQYKIYYGEPILNSSKKLIFLILLEFLCVYVYTINTLLLLVEKKQDQK